jgi:serine protease Do
MNKAPNRNRTASVYIPLALLLSVAAFCVIWPMASCAQDDNQAPGAEAGSGQLPQILSTSTEPLTVNSEAVNTAKKVSQAFTEIAEKTSPAVVFIEVEKTVRQGLPFSGPEGPGLDNLRDFLRQFFGQGFQFPSPQGPMAPSPGPGVPMPYGQGSGFIMSSDGYIVTNVHVISGADRVLVTLSDGRQFDADIVGTDPKTEVALIKVDAAGLPILPLGDSNNIRTGESVLAIGNPFGLSHTVTSGIVSARGRGNVGLDVDYADFIQTDAAINPGNSGGPLLNLDGQVIGMNTAILSRTGGYMGIGFAIPINMVKFITDQLAKTGTITRGFLGITIQPLTPELARQFGLEEGRGVLVAGIEPDSPASQGGIKQGDIIVEYQGQKISDLGSFRSRVATTAPGTTVSITVMRDGRPIKLDVAVGTLAQEGPTGAPLTGQEETRRELGLVVQDLDPALAQQFGYEDEEGVVITQVEPGSVAFLSGLKPGTLITEVDRKPVANTQEFRDAIKTASDDILLLVKENVEGRAYAHYVVLSKNR